MPIVLHEVIMALTTICFKTQTVPKLVDATSLENKNARSVSCGARHSAIITGTFSCSIVGYRVLQMFPMYHPSRYYMFKLLSPNPF
jgi:hypothetical protein